MDGEREDNEELGPRAHNDPVLSRLSIESENMTSLALFHLYLHLRALLKRHARHVPLLGTPPAGDRAYADEAAYV